MRSWRTDDEFELLGFDEPGQQMLGATLADRKRLRPFLHGAQRSSVGVRPDSGLEVSLVRSFFRV